MFETFKTLMIILVLNYINTSFTPGFKWVIIPSIFLSIGLARKIFIAKANAANDTRDDEESDGFDLRELDHTVLKSDKKGWKDSDLV